MPYFLEVPLANGDTVLAEITRQVDDVEPFGRGTDIVGRLPGSFIDDLDRIQEFSGEVLQRLRGSCEPPDRVAVEFGLTLSAKSGLVIAEVSGEGHLAVTIEWCRSSRPIGSPPAPGQAVIDPGSEQAGMLPGQGSPAAGSQS